jgi:hypothetical protein
MLLLLSNMIRIKQLAHSYISLKAQWSIKGFSRFVMIVRFSGFFPSAFLLLILFLFFVPSKSFSLPYLGSRYISGVSNEAGSNVLHLNFAAPIESDFLPFGISLGTQAGINGIALDHPLLGKGLYPQVELGFRLGLDFRLIHLWGMSFNLVQGYQLPIRLGNQVIIPRGIEYLEGQFLITRYIPLNQTFQPIVASSESHDQSNLPPHSFRPHIQGLSLRAGLGLAYANYLYTQVFLWYPSIQISALVWSQPIAGLPLGFLYGPELSLGLRRDPGLSLSAGFLIQVVLPL